MVVFTVDALTRAHCGMKANSFTQIKRSIRWNPM